MIEINQNALREAVAHLPEHEPPASVWTQIDAVLETDRALAVTARALPTYTPPPAVWRNITDRLPIPRHARRRITLWPRYAAAAAVTTCLFGAWWLLHASTEMYSPEQIVVTQEIIDQRVVETARESEDPAFQQLQQLCAARTDVCAQPEFKRLKSELDELTAAKQQLSTALGQYGDDPGLAAQLVQIELARTQVLQKIMLALS